MTFSSMFRVPCSMFIKLCPTSRDMGHSDQCIMTLRLMHRALCPLSRKLWPIAHAPESHAQGTLSHVPATVSNVTWHCVTCPGNFVPCWGKCLRYYIAQWVLCPMFRQLCPIYHDTVSECAIPRVFFSMSGQLYLQYQITLSFIPRVFCPTSRQPCPISQDIISNA
jgi:hypothetical protein